MWQAIFNLNNYLFNPYSVPLLVVGTVILLLGSFVLFKNLKQAANRIFFMVSLSIAWWLVIFSFAYNASVPLAAEGLIKIGFLGVISLAPAIFHFMVSFLGKSDKYKKLVFINYLTAIISAVLLFTTPYILNGVTKYFWGYYTNAGKLFMPFLVWYSWVIVLACLKYIIYFSQARKNQEANKIQFKQAKLILLGFVIMVFGSVDFLPNFGIKIYPFGYLCAMLYMSIFAYMIIRYRLMEIDTVIHRTILWLISSGFIVFPIWVLLYFFKRWVFNLGLLQVSVIVTLIFFILKYIYNAVQPKIDYIFRRRKYDYYQALGLIASRVGTELEIREIILKLFQELKNTLYMKNGLILTKSSENYDFEEIYRLGYEDLYVLELAQKTKAYLKKDSELLRYLTRKPAGMEKDMLLLDPQCGAIKDEAVAFFNANSLELLVPIVLEGDIKGLLGLGKKVNLQKYTHKDVQLLETLGQQLGVIFDNALRHGDLIKKELLDRITDGLDEGIMLLDKDYRVIWANKKIIDAMPAGMNPVNRYCYELTHRAKEPCSEKEHFCPLSAAVKTQGVSSAIHVHHAKNGDLAYVEVIAYPLKDAEGNVSEYIHISRDITQKKNMEDDLQNNILNLEKTREELEGKLKELEIFNKIAVDRELKMIELKSKIAQLEAKQKNGAEGGS